MTSILSQQKWVFKAINSNAIISKWKNIAQFFLYFRNLHQFLNPLKKIRASEVIFFWNYRLQKAGLIKCLKSYVSEHLWTANMFRGPKHCLNQHGSIFVVFFDQHEKKWAEKWCLSSIWNLKTICQDIDTRWQVFSRSKSECLMQPIQMQLSRYRKIFSEFCSAFPKST